MLSGVSYLLTRTGLLVSGAKGQTVDKALRGLTAVGITMDVDSEGARRIGITEEGIRTDVELKLRLAGVQVLTAEERRKAGAAILYVKMNMFEDTSSASVSLEILQDVFLYRDPSVAVPLAVTWGSDLIISRPTRAGVREAIKDKVDKFLNAWLTANPKPH